MSTHGHGHDGERDGTGAGEPPMSCERSADGAAYVLGALGQDELQAYREHLAECVACTAEVAILQGVADALARGVPSAAAPQGLRSRVVAIAYAEAEQQQQQAAGRREADLPARPARRLWPWRLAPTLASAAALAAGLLIGAFAINTGSTVQRTQTQIIRAVVVAPGHNASAELRKAGAQVELIVTGMPAPPRGRIYEVWLLRRGAQAPAPTTALFSVTTHGAGAVAVPGGVSGVAKVLVTDEPLGGSLKPTRTPIIVAST